MSLKDRLWVQLGVWRARAPGALALFTAVALGLSVGLTVNLLINAPAPRTITRTVYVPWRAPIHAARKAEIQVAEVQQQPPSPEHPRILNPGTAPTSPAADTPAPPAPITYPPPPPVVREAGAEPPVNTVQHSKATARRLLCLKPQIRQIFDTLESQFGQLEVIATCDHSRFVAGTRRISRHASGNAIDFLPGKRRAAILAYLLAHHHSGLTMTYPGSPHIHVDVGPYRVILAARDRDQGRAPAVYGRISHARDRVATWRHWRRYRDDEDDDD